MSNTGISHGVNIKGNQKVKKAIISLSKYGLITFSREQSFKSSKYTIHFFKPIEDLKSLYNLGNEVLILSCADGMRDFKSRTKDFLDYILSTKEEFRNRLDKVTCFLIDDNNSIVKIVEDDRIENPDSRLIIPFSLNELQNGISSENFNKRLRDFLYVRDLFGIASPIKSEEMFFGEDRFGLLSDLYGKYKQGEPGGLFGLRRIGKTSVLFLLRNRINNNGGIAVYFDCTRYHHLRWNGLLNQIIKKIVEEYRFDNDKHPIELPLNFEIDLDNARRYSTENAINSFESDLKKIFEALGSVRIHLIFDEIESISYNTSPTDYWRNQNDFVFFWQALRSVNQMNDGLFSYLIAGVNPMCVEIASINGNDNPIFGGFSPTYMKLFSYDDVNHMISSIGGHIGLKFDAELCLKLVEDYGGHPFLTRQVCSIINKKYLDSKEIRPLKVSKYDYEKHADEYRSNMTSVIEQILAVLNTYYPNEFDLLKRLALNGTEAFKNENMGGDKSVQHLLGYCLIEKHNNDYFIRIKTIAKYLQNKFIFDKSLNTQTDIRSRINYRRDIIESKLRLLIWNNTFLKYGKKTKDRIMELAKKYSPNDDKQRAKMKNKTGQSVMEELYLDQLGKIISDQWKEYEVVFSDKKKFYLYFEILNESRNVASHTKTVTSDDETDYNLVFKYFEKCLEEI